MEFTGERMVPEKADKNTFWEHVYRYRFAIPFVGGKRVLDIACGEGYGSAAFLQAGADVIGVDISPDACIHANQKYGVETRVGDGQKIPLESSSVDVVVSFETIEHVPDPKMFLDECQRVLRPSGLLIISTPNRDAARFYSPDNPFHCSELTVEEFKSMIEERFSVQSYYSQRPFWAVWWSSRGITALRWSIRRIRGIGRLTTWLRCLFCPHLTDRGTNNLRQRPTDAIRKKPVPFSSFIDTYAIRRLLPASVETPLIVIAVALRGKADMR